MDLVSGKACANSFTPSAPISLYPKSIVWTFVSGKACANSFTPSAPID